MNDSGLKTLLESCLYHFSYLVQESCHSVVFPSTKKNKKIKERERERDPRKTHHSPAAKTHKINTHRCGTQQPLATNRRKAQHLTSLTSRHNPKPNTSPSNTADAKSPRRAATTPPCLMPPLSPHLHAATRHRSPMLAEDPYRRDCLCLQFNLF